MREMFSWFSVESNLVSSVCSKSYDFTLETTYFPPGDQENVHLTYQRLIYIDFLI